MKYVITFRQKGSEKVDIFPKTFEYLKEAEVKAKMLAGETPQNVYYVLVPSKAYQTTPGPVVETTL